MSGAESHLQKDIELAHWLVHPVQELASAQQHRLSKRACTGDLTLEAWRRCSLVGQEKVPELVCQAAFIWTDHIPAGSKARLHMQSINHLVQQESKAEQKQDKSAKSCTGKNNAFPVME